MSEANKESILTASNPFKNAACRMQSAITNAIDRIRGHDTSNIKTFELEPHAVKPMKIAQPETLEGEGPGCHL